MSYSLCQLFKTSIIDIFNPSDDEVHSILTIYINVWIT